MSEVRLSLRLARREVLRRPGRTALVSLLVAIPVMGMVMALVLLRTGTHTLDEQWQQRYGSADAVDFSGVPRGLPEDARYLQVVATGGQRVLSEGGHRATLEVEDLDPDDPLAAGRSAIVAGRAPRTSGEIALTSGAMDKLHVGVGDTLVLTRPDARLAVVGEVAYAECYRCPRAVVAPGRIADLPGGAAGEGSVTLLDLSALSPSEQQALAGPDSAFHLRSLNATGAYLSPDTVDASSISWTLVIGALVLTVVGIVISAAFAVGARRQLVTIGQLSASGAPPRAVRRALLLQGTVTGALGAIAGIALAAAVCVGLRHQVEFVLDQPIDAYRFQVGEIVLAALIGVAAATVAALIPARSAARIPTLAALAGRRPLAPVSRGLVVKGLVAVVCGLGLFGLAILGGRGRSSNQVWAYVAILGGVTEILGACALAPAIVAWLEPLAHRLRGGLRLGARGLARQRARTGAVVSAVCAAGALAVAAGGAILGSAVFQDSVDARTPDDVVLVSAETNNPAGPGVAVPPPAEVVAAVAAAIPDASRSTLREIDQATTDPSRRAWVIRDDASPDAPSTINDYFSESGFATDAALIADDAIVDALRVPAAGRKALADEGMVVLGPSVSGTVRVVDPAGGTHRVPLVASKYILSYPPTILVSPATADELGLAVHDHGVLFHNAGALSSTAVDAIEDVEYETYDQNGADPDRPYVRIDRSLPRNGPTEAQLELILGGLALVFALFVVGVSLALAAAESKDERDILTIAGAPPATVARSAGARAWLMATIGAVMAVPVGFLPIVVVHFTSDSGGYVTSQLPLVFPSRTVALLVLAVPAIVAIVAYGASAAAQRLRPVRISTATFE